MLEVIITLNEIRIAAAVIGTAICQYIGGFDGLLEALVIFSVIDYITGVFCAINERTLSSSIGFKGIMQKVLIFLLVAIANIVDARIIGEDKLLRTAVIFFYLSNEGISILENAARLGLPIPDKLRDILHQLRQEKK